MIELVRFGMFADRTLGKFRLNDHSWWSIEREWADNQPNVSCIPDGVYQMKRVDSPKFGKNMWEVCDVPNRSHILIHVGNYANNFLGCIGLGKGTFANLAGVGRSKDAISEFYKATEGLDEIEILIRTGAIR